MRTTITLDPDVDALLRTLMCERGLSLDKAVSYSFPTYDLGEPTVDLAHSLQIAATLEDEEIARKMSIGR